MQRERNAGEARAGGMAVRAQREASHIGKLRGEGACWGFRPLTAKVGLI
jgi:hypothetical protein